MAWEGALGVVPSSCKDLVVSPEFPVFEIDRGRMLPEIMDIYFRTPAVWPELAAISTGTNVRRRRLNPSAFLNFTMPAPSMDEQIRIREVKRQADEIKELEATSHVEFNGLMPSILDKAFRGDL